MLSNLNKSDYEPTQSSVHSKERNIRRESSNHKKLVYNEKNPGGYKRDHHGISHPVS